MNSSASTDFSARTYEATKADEWDASQADRIHWERQSAYRNQAYRQLHHQEGVVGTFQIRLLEAADLKRSYWSALALGPVKLLGLSKAHGAVSSFVSFGWAEDKAPPTEPQSAHDEEEDNRKPAAAGSPQKKKDPPLFVSPVIPHDDNPVWTNCVFNVQLRKGACEDGQTIRLQVRVDEESTAVENLVPGIPSGGNSRMLGIGTLDLTSLCLGQVVATGQPQVGVLDTWVPITLQDEEGPSEVAIQESLLKHVYCGEEPLKKPQPTQDATMGRVRILASYQPNGIGPRKGDIVALEAFARQDPRRVSCPPLLPPLLPLYVVEQSGPWILVEYSLPRYGAGRARRVPDKERKACLKLHRNAVFVIERKNLVDETVNLALLPADIFLSTPFGRSTQELMGPVVVASKQLLMPAFLSVKLVWMAVRTTGLATVSGVHAASSALWSEGSSSLTQDEETHRRRQAQNSVAARKGGSNYKFVTL